MAEVEIIEVEDASMNGMTVYQQDKAIIDRQIATAKQYPRSLKQCLENAITIATLDIETAKSCNYSLVKGGKSIVGPSVHLAKIVAQQYGNMRIENRVVGYDDTHVTCEAVCFDLEKNFAIRTTIKKSIVGNSGRFSADMQTIIGNAGNAIALRNAIFAVIPANIIKKVYDAAMEASVGKLSDPNELIKRRTLCIDFFKNSYPDLNLTDEEIAKAVGKVSINHLTKDDLITLLGYEESMKQGECSPIDVFRPQINNSRNAKPNAEDKSSERLLKLIEAAKDRKGLEPFKKECITPDLISAYDKRFKELA